MQLKYLNMNKTVVKYLTFITLVMSIIVSSVNTYSQSNSWQFHKEKDNVQIFYNYTECRDASQGIHQEQVLLRFKNNNNYAVTVKWQLEAWYENKCSTCGLDEYKFELKIPAGEGISGECNIYSDSKLRIFSKFLDFDAPVSLEKFNISIINIAP